MTRFDLTLYGATGFTGGLVAEYLCRRAPTMERPLSFAIAGRSPDKLDALKRRLAHIDPAAAALPTLIASTEAEEQLHALAAKSRVVISTAGPFMRHGPPLVKACLKEGAHYLDITGEPAFVAQVLEEDAAARAAGLCLINCCGFDSLPHDLGAYFTMKSLAELEGPVRMTGYVRVKAGASGGTVRSLIEALGADPDSAPLGLTAGRPEYSEDAGAWTLPLPTIDGAVIRRSAAALNYAPQFSYAHKLALPSWAKAAATAAGMALLTRGAAWAPTRPLLERFAPDPGTGPSPERRAKSWFSLLFSAERGGTRALSEVSGGDPGYEETAKMLSEAALCLAFDEDRPQRFGALTPASALGEPLLNRLQAAGIRFTRLA